MESIENKEFLNQRISPEFIHYNEFYYCRFINCQFDDLPAVKFFDCKFSNCDLANIKLQNTQIRNCTFKDSKLLGIGISRNNFAFSANFYSCDLRYAEFLELYLRHMEIENCNCEGTRFTNCDLRNVKFLKSNFKEAIFSKCDLQKARFSDNKFLSINPTVNKIKQTIIDLETSVNISTIFGFNVKL